MPFKVVIRSVSGQYEQFERAYDQDVVRIGRQDSSDLHLRDSQRMIGRQHAEIRQKDNAYSLVDRGSKNGTALNGQRLVVGKEYPLDMEDQITIGDFTVQFYPLPVGHDPHEMQDESTTMLIPRIAPAAQGLIDTLRRAYGEHILENDEEREQILVETLRRALQGLDEINAQKMFDWVESHFFDPERQQEKIWRGFQNPSEGVSLQKGSLPEAALQGITKIAEKYFQDRNPLQSSQDIEEFIERIDRVLAILLNGLTKSIKGRKEFEREFDVEATQIFFWKPNPVKLANDDREMGEYLLNGKEGKAWDKVDSNLEEAFTDLTLHQMGIMAGFKEGLRGLLEKMDPRSLEVAAHANPITVGPFKIPCSFEPLLSWVAWNQFKKRYREISEKEVKTFETIWGPFFTKGYLAVQKKKKTS